MNPDLAHYWKISLNKQNRLRQPLPFVITQVLGLFVIVHRAVVRTILFANIAIKHPNDDIYDGP